MIRTVIPLLSRTTSLIACTRRPAITTTTWSYKAIEIKGVRNMSDIKKIHTANACPRKFSILSMLVGSWGALLTDGGVAAGPYVRFFFLLPAKASISYNEYAAIRSIRFRSYTTPTSTSANAHTIDTSHCRRPQCLRLRPDPC
jgi:hypothetical protein